MWGFSIIPSTYSAIHLPYTYIFPHKLFNKNGKYKMYCGSSLNMYLHVSQYNEIYLFSMYCTYKKGNSKENVN